MRMFGFLIWLIIIIWVIAAVNRNKNKNGRKNTLAGGGTWQPIKKEAEAKKYTSPAKPAAQPLTAEQQMAMQEKQRDLKARLQQKYKAPSDSGILERAKATVEEDFSRDYRNPGQPEIKPQHIDLAVKKMTSAAANNGQRAGYDDSRLKTQDRKKEPREESYGDVMREIEDLMIKGPNMEITFERDFLSEGLDLLNRIQA